MIVQGADRPPHLNKIKNSPKERNDMEESRNLTEGSIYKSLIRFVLPVLAAMLLQSLYGGVDLFVVGRFAETADVSGVASGSIFIQTITMVVTSLSTGVTVVIGQRIGEGKREEAGRAVTSGIAIFAVAAVIVTLIVALFPEQLSVMMDAPEEAFTQTVQYIRICGIGSFFIIAYNLLGAIFRGIGDSKTPLLAVGVACVLNIIGDLVFVLGFGMGAAGAALATVIAQALSVVISVIYIAKKELPFELRRPKKEVIGEELRVGAPLGLQELLVGISFVVVQTAVNGISLVASAGVGVGEKVCAFISLIPMGCMQAVAAFVAQNIGAQKPDRAKKATVYAMVTSVAVCLLIGAFTFFRGDLLAAIFDSEAAVIAAAHSYLKSYAIDIVLASVLFSLIGYFDGCGKTMFVMIQGLVGALLVRVPYVLTVSKIPGVSLFAVGMGTPCATVAQLLLFLVFWLVLKRKAKASPLA